MQLSTGSVLSKASDLSPRSAGPETTSVSRTNHPLKGGLRSPQSLFAPRPAVVEAGILKESAGSAAVGLLSPQLTACFTSATILASSASVNSLSAKAVGHMAPSSRFASCMKPNVAYLVLNFCAL